MFRVLTRRLIMGVISAWRPSARPPEAMRSEGMAWLGQHLARHVLFSSTLPKQAPLPFGIGCLAVLGQWQAMRKEYAD